MITRRRILAASAAMSTASLVGSGAVVGGVALQWWDRPAGSELLALSDEEHALAQSIAEAWFPPGGSPQLSGAEAKLGDFLDAVIAHMLPETAREMKLLLHALDALPLATQGHFFTSLDLQTRTEVLRSWLQHDNHLIRSAAAGVMVLLGVGWTTHPEVAPILNPWFGCHYGR